MPSLGPIGDWSKNCGGTEPYTRQPNPVRRVDSDLLFLLVIVGFYVLRHLTGAKQKQGAPRPANRPELPPLPGETVEEERDPELDEALREIRRALGMPVPDEPHAPPEPRKQSPAHPPAPTPAPPRRTSLPSRLGTGPRRRDDEFREVRTGRPDAEERFERTPRGQAMPATREKATSPFRPASTRIFDDATVSPRDDAFGWHDPLEGHSHLEQAPTVVDATPRSDHPLAVRLRSPEALREAIVLREVLSPPKAFRRR